MSGKKFLVSCFLVWVGGALASEGLVCELSLCNFTILRNPPKKIIEYGIQCPEIKRIPIRRNDECQWLALRDSSQREPGSFVQFMVKGETTKEGHPIYPSFLGFVDSGSAKIFEEEKKDEPPYPSFWGKILRRPSRIKTFGPIVDARFFVPGTNLFGCWIQVSTEHSEKERRFVYEMGIWVEDKNDCEKEAQKELDENLYEGVECTYQVDSKEEQFL